MKTIRNGFIMIELMIVGIVAAVAMPAWQQHNDPDEYRQHERSNTTCVGGYKHHARSGQQIRNEAGGGIPCGESLSYPR